MNYTEYWRGRVRFWRFVAIPISSATVAVIAGVFGFLLSRGQWAIAAFALLPFVPAVISLYVAWDGLRFVSKTLRQHEAEERYTPAGLPHGESK